MKFIIRFSLATLVVVATLGSLAACSSESPAEVNTCLSGADCGGICVQLATDGANCGACGTSCSPGEVCSAGHCAASCAAPLAVCGSGAAARCADLRSDPSSCGSCGHTCADGQLCAGGTCVETCAAPLTACSDGTSSSCADVRFDPAHCGSCDTRCAEGDVCSGGQCRPACSEPLSACGTGDAALCADLRNDPEHCGACDIACPAGQACGAGVCGPRCAAPLTVCGVGDAARCVDLRSDATSCGTCGHACADGEACLAGACVATCTGAGGTLCDGACVDLASDDANCGACGHACPSGTACHAGVCEATCPGAQIPCGGVCLDPSSDPENCGACGNTCSTGICRAGACSAAACEGTIGLPGRPLPPPSTSVDQPFDHALADLDGDGVLDLAIPRRAGNLVEIRYVRAHGVLGPPVDLAVADHPEGIAAGDVDGDGRPDVVACSTGGAGAISLLRNRGDGTFERTDFPTNGAVRFCALGDLDGDGRPDLVLSYPRDARIAVAHNTGGGFAVPVPYASRPSPTNIAVADLDGDGRLDVLALISPNSVDPSMPELDRGSVSVYPGAGDGTLGAPASYATGIFPEDLVVADLDGDGRLDVATGAFDEQAVAILLNNGSGALLPRRLVPLGNRPISLAAGDLDRDGTIDLVVNRIYEDVVVLRNDGHAGFAAPEIYAITGEELALADADRDGVLDLYNASFWPQVVLQEAGRLLAPTRIPFAGGGRVTLTDLDGDGRADAIVGPDALFGNGALILHGRADGGFDSPPAITFFATQRLAIGDIDGDGDIDLVHDGIGGIIVRRNRGDGSFGPEERIGADAPGIPAPALADLDGDGDLDLVVAYHLELPGFVQVYWNDGGGGFQPGPRLTAGGNATTPVIGAVTGSGRPDIVVPNMFDGTVSVFQGHADGRFTLFATLPVPVSPISALIADVTQDGRADLVVGGLGPLSTFAPSIRIYPGLDHGLGAAIDLPTHVGPDDLASADLDSDGLRDLIVIGGQVAFFRALPGGGLAAPVYYAGAGGAGLAIRDLTGDLRADLVTVTDLNASGLSVLTNRCLSP